MTFAYAVVLRPEGGVNEFFDINVNDVVKRIPAGGLRRIIVEGGAGNDDLDASGAAIPRPAPSRAVIANGGPGDDTITGSIAVDKLVGGNGNDRIFARDNNADEVLGGKGQDQAQINPPDEMGLNGDRARGVEVLLP